MRRFSRHTLQPTPLQCSALQHHVRSPSVLHLQQNTAHWAKCLAMRNDSLVQFTAVMSQVRGGAPPAERLGSACKEMAKGWVALKVKVATPPRMTGRWPHHATCSMSTRSSGHNSFMAVPTSCASSGELLSTFLQFIQDSLLAVYGLSISLGVQRFR